jgi:hypothetical protein
MLYKLRPVIYMLRYCLRKTFGLITSCRCAVQGGVVPKILNSSKGSVKRQNMWCLANVVAGYVFNLEIYAVNDENEVEEVAIVLNECFIVLLPSIIA